MMKYLFFLYSIQIYSLWFIPVTLYFNQVLECIMFLEMDLWVVSDVFKSSHKSQWQHCFLY